MARTALGMCAPKGGIALGDKWCLASGSVAQGKLVVQSGTWIWPADLPRLCDGAPAARYLALAAMCAVLSMGLVAQPAKLDDGLRKFLKTRLPFSSADLLRVQNGEPVVVALESNSQKAIGIAGVVWVEGDPAQFLDDQRTMSEHSGTKSMSAGIFGNPASLNDLRDLKVDPADLEALAICSAGDCSVKLFGEDARNLSTSANGGHADGKNVTAVYRQALLRSVNAYKARGNEALGFYVDKADAVDAAAEFETILNESEFLRAAAPGLERYLRQYPKAKPRNTEDIFYWSKISFGLKPTVRVNHMALYANEGNPRIPWVIASKQIYAAHYLQAALELRFLLIPEGRQPRHGFYLLTVSRSRNDGMEGFWRGIVRTIVKSKAQDGVKRYLAFTQERMGRIATLEAQNVRQGKTATVGQ